MISVMRSSTGGLDLKLRQVPGDAFLLTLDALAPIICSSSLPKRPSVSSGRNAAPSQCGVFSCARMMRLRANYLILAHVRFQALKTFAAHLILALCAENLKLGHYQSRRIGIATRP